MLRRVLIVDDDPAICELIESVLSLDGFAVGTAHDGQSALDCVAADKPNLVLLDLMMPVMDGPTVARHLRANPETRDIAIVLMSADRQVADRVGELGADGYVAKPFELAQLEACISQFLSSATTRATTIH